MAAGYVTAQWTMITSALNGPALWSGYGEDIHTTADDTDFISDGSAKGMKVGDLVLYRKSTATIGVTAHVITAVTAGGAATMSPAILA